MLRRRSACGSRGGFCFAGRTLPEADERKMTERRDRTALNKMDIRRTRGPADIALPRELGAPAKFARRRREEVLDRLARPGLGADTGQDDDFAAGLKHPCELIERRFRVLYGRHDVLCDH